MKREDHKILEELSVQVFGKPYAWKRLTTKGIYADIKKAPKGGIARRMPLTIQGAKHYMETTLAMRKKIQKKLEEKNETNDNE